MKYLIFCISIIFFIKFTQSKTDFNFYVSDSNQTFCNHTNKLLNKEYLCHNKDEDKYQKPIKFRDDYTFYPGFGYYKYHIHPAAWFSAKYICELEGAHLIVLNSQMEANLLKMIFSSYPRSKIDYPNHIIIGFHDLHTEGKYDTISGISVEDSGFTKWAPNSPSHSTEENCGAFFNGGLDDITCTVLCNFVCEKEL